MDILRILNLLLNLAISAFFVVGAYLMLQHDVREFTKNKKVCLGADFKFLVFLLLVISLIGHYFWQILLLPIFLGAIVILFPKITMPIKESALVASLGFSTILLLAKLSNDVHLPSIIVVALALAPTALLLIVKFYFFIKGGE